MTMKLSNQFEKQRQAFLDAVANGAPQEEQAKLYNDMIESMTNEMMAQARDAAREEVRRCAVSSALRLGSAQFMVQ